MSNYFDHLLLLLQTSIYYYYYITFLINSMVTCFQTAQTEFHFFIRYIISKGWWKNIYNCVAYQKLLVRQGIHRQTTKSSGSFSVKMVCIFFFYKFLCHKQVTYVDVLRATSAEHWNSQKSLSSPAAIEKPHNTTFQYKDSLNFLAMVTMTALLKKQKGMMSCHYAKVQLRKSPTTFLKKSNKHTTIAANTTVKYCTSET